MNSQRSKLSGFYGWLPAAIPAVAAFGVCLSLSGGAAAQPLPPDAPPPPPTFVATVEPAYYEGHAAYWYGNHWYWRDVHGWHWYANEPAALHERRAHPPPRHYYEHGHRR